MSKLTDIITALRARITSAGFTISKEAVEDDTDSYVMIFMAGDGDKTDRITPVHQKTVHLVADHRFRHTDDWLLEGVEKQRELEEAIFTGPATDSPDNLNDIAISVEPIKSSTAPEETTKLTSAQVHVRITYKEQ